MSKHYFIKTHAGHRWMLNLILVFLIVGAFMWLTAYREGLADYVSNNPELLTNALLLLLNVLVIILIVVTSYFFLELKDAFIKEEEELIRGERAILRKVSGKRKKR